MGDKCVIVAAAGGVVLSIAVQRPAQLTAFPATVLFGVGMLFLTALVGEGCQKSFRNVVAALGGAALASILPYPIDVGAAPVVGIAIGHQRGDIFQLLARLDDDPRPLIGRRARVSGQWHRSRGPLAATVSRRVMSCCAADAVAVGFEVMPRMMPSVAEAAEVSVDGVVAARIVEGETRYLIVNADVKALSAGSSAEN